jgi:hypothetical protein
MFALDFAGLDDVIGLRGKAGQVAQSQTDVNKPTQQQPLRLTDLREG